MFTLFLNTFILLNNNILIYVFCYLQLTLNELSHFCFIQIQFFIIFYKKTHFIKIPKLLLSKIYYFYRNIK